AAARETTMEEALDILSRARGGQALGPAGAAGRTLKGAGLPPGSWRSHPGGVVPPPLAPRNPGGGRSRGSPPAPWGPPRRAREASRAGRVGCRLLGPNSLLRRSRGEESA